MEILKKLIVVTMSIVMVACGNSQKDSNKDDKAQIVTTSFIAYDLIHEIGKGKVDVVNILPWGSELHDFEPTAKDVAKINDADLFVFLSEELEPWVKTNADNKNSLNLSKSYTLAEHVHNHEESEEIHSEEHGHSEEHNHDHATLHFWCDPTTYLQLIEKTRDKLIKVDPDNKEFFEKNAQAYYDKILKLHEDFDEYLDNIETKAIYFSGHNAMDAFADRYHLTITALSDEYRPDADLTSKQLIKLQDELVASDTHYLFTEELVEPRVAEQIKKSLENDGYSLTILELHSYHNISKKQYENGVSYADLYEQNIKNIKQSIQP